MCRLRSTQKKLHELETGEFRAEPLNEVLSRDEIDPEVLVPQWDSKGTVVLKKASSKGAMPSGPEQLRLRLTIMQNALLMIGLHHPGRAEIKDIDFQLFERYKDYLLGEFCYGLRTNEASGSLVPPCTLVLSYEHAIRKQCYKQMTLKGIGFADALVWSWKDAATKERQFTTPLSLCHKRPQPWLQDKPDKGGGKGKQNGKANNGNKKQKLNKAAKGGYTRTSDNKPICFRFNAKGGCKKGANKCHFVHVCTKCRGNHSAMECTATATAEANSSNN